MNASCEQKRGVAVLTVLWTNVAAAPQGFVHLIQLPRQVFLDLVGLHTKAHTQW